MNAKLRGLAFITASLLIAGVPSAKAEVMIETISSPPIFPGESFEPFFPEDYHLDMQKLLTFEGSVQTADLHLPTTVLMWFDWIDPRIPASPVQTSPAITIHLLPVPDRALFFGPTALTYTIPFCPPEVSIHFQNIGPGGPVFVSGTFTHACVPEPVALAIVPLIALMAPLALRGVKAFAGSV